MRVLSSFTLSIILCIVVSVAIITSFTVDYFSVIVENNIAKIKGMEQSTDFEALEKKLNDIGRDAQANGIKVYSKNDALDIIIKYADYLLSTYNARAETDYPEDANNVLQLHVKFSTSFNSAQMFLDTIGQMLKMKSPIIQINSVDFNNEGGENKAVAGYKIDVDAFIIQPYISGDGNNGKQ